LFHTKNGKPGGQCDGIFWGPCLVCPMSMGFGMPGPRVLGVISWCPEGSKGGNVVGFFRAHAYLGIQRGLRGAM